MVNDNTAIGTPINNGDNKKAMLKHRVEKIRLSLLAMEEIYYSFRDDTEKQFQETKFQLDKLEKFIGEQV